LFCIQGADGLCKRPDWKVGTENNNEKIKRTKEEDKEVVRVVEKIKKVGIKASIGDKWEIDGELVLKEGKVYVLRDEVSRLEVEDNRIGDKELLVAGSDKRCREICGGL